MSSHEPTFKLTMDGYEVPIFMYTRRREPNRPYPETITLTAAYDPVEYGKFAAKQSLIAFAKTGAPPEHAWVDGSPTYAAVLKARDQGKTTVFPDRVLPRVVEQKPYDQIVREQFECACHERMGNDFWFLPSHACLQGSCTRFAKPKSLRPESLSDFAKEVHAANAHWWHDPATGDRLYRNTGELLMLVVSEIAECMEGERKDLMDDHLPHRKMAEVELADAVIRIADIAGAFSLDLTQTDRLPGEDMKDNKGESLLAVVGMMVAFDWNCEAHYLGDAVELMEAYAEKHSYDLWGAVAEKREYNKHRADHKPEARLAANGKKF